MTALFSDDKAGRDEEKKAREQAAKIIQAANEQAERIIRETHFFTRQVQNDLRTTLEETAQQVAEQSKAETNRLLEQHRELFAGFLRSLRESTEEQMKALATVSQEQVQALRESLDTAATAKRQELEEQAEAAKTRRLQAIEEELTEAIPQLLQDVLGRAIPLTEHERIVKERLAELKDQGVWKK